MRNTLIILGLVIVTSFIVAAFLTSCVSMQHGYQPMGCEACSEGLKRTLNP